MDDSHERLSVVVARAIHEVWRWRMLSAGWRPGDRYSEELRTHEALVPFDELPPHLQADAEFCAIAGGVIDAVAEHDPHPRGYDSFVVPSAIRDGLSVASAHDEDETGEVIGWSLDEAARAEYGWPLVVHVRWLDGSESSRALGAWELVVGPGDEPAAPGPA